MDEQELLDVVDKNDKVIGQDTKENKFLKGLVTRCVAVFIIDRKEKIMIAKRSSKKKSFPNRYDATACGNVKAGEDYNEAAQREVKEELGIRCDLKFLGKVFNEFQENSKTLRHFTGIFSGRFDEEIRLSDELVEIQKLSVEEIESLISKNKELFTPGFVKDFLYVKDKLK